MAEAIGTALGVVGFLGQLFDGCVKAYKYFSAASNLDADSQRLLCKVRIEEMRLVVWGREWGVAEGKLEAHLAHEQRQNNPQLRLLATQILQELHATVTDFQKLQSKYGLSAGASSSSPSPGAEKKGSDGEDEKKTPNGTGKVSGGVAAGERSWRKEIALRTKWVIQDKDKFTALLRDLKGTLTTDTPSPSTHTPLPAHHRPDFNDGLERLFPPSQLPYFQRAWTNSLLESARRDVAQLSLLENASSGVYPQLHASANLKKLRINLDSRPSTGFKPTFALKVHWDALDFSPHHPAAKSGNDGNSNGNCNGNSNGNGNGNGRCHATHNREGDVLVEWVAYDQEAIEERVAHMKRLDDLARMMRSASSCHPDLHSVDCVGYTDDKSACRYGLVYKAPAASHSTLHALIASRDLRTPDLCDRVRLAATLAVSLWSLHSLDWLHKSLCASNVLFFPAGLSNASQTSTAAAALVPDVSRPFLAGFDASRPDLDAALSVVARNPSIAELHRHPAVLRGGRPHTKAFDVYSLGLVLLEIGLWKVLQTYHKPHYSAERWRDRVVLAVLVPGLGSKTGRRYAEVVEMCLRASDEMTSAEAGKLMETVVGKLESIHV
ncbi:hypothetical protein PWT90_07816 [Aphanocladium album]|nr:hypothetical protein PWT90_07816 [Aphanocladium album]